MSPETVAFVQRNKNCDRVVFVAIFLARAAVDFHAPSLYRFILQIA